MLYAILCYHDETVVNSWSREEDDAVIAKRQAVTDRLKARGKLGPVARLMPTRRRPPSGMAARPSSSTVRSPRPRSSFSASTSSTATASPRRIETAREMGLNETGGAFEVRPLRIFQKGTG